MRQKPLFIILFSLFLCGTISAQVDFNADDVEGCAPFIVHFSLDTNTVDTDTLTSVLWDFGNGTSLDTINPPSILYSAGGTYTVSIILNGDAANPVIKTTYITVHTKVLANFDMQLVTEPYTYEFAPTNTITDASATYFYRWEYYNNVNTRIYNKTYIATISNQNTSDIFTFSDTGSYRIFLNISDSYGCEDSLSQTLHIEAASDTSDTTSNDTTQFVVGNVFAPLSQTYFIIEPDDDVVLSFIVYSRTGVILYCSESNVIYWDGATNNGRDLPTDVYFYTLKAVNGDPAKRYSKSGFIHLFR